MTTKAPHEVKNLKSKFSMKYPSSNDQVSTQFQKSLNTFSFEDLIRVDTLDERLEDNFQEIQVAEQGVAYGFDRSEAFKSTFDISKTVSPYIRDLKHDDVKQLRSVVSRTLDNYKSILELNPERVLELIEDFGKYVKVINKKLMDLYNQINQLLQHPDVDSDASSNLSEKTFFEILDGKQLSHSIFDKISSDKNVKGDIEALLQKSLDQYQQVKVGYMRLRALQVVQNNYHSHLFQDKMHDLEKNCLQIITKGKIDDVKRGVDYLTPVGRYKIFAELTKKPEDKKQPRIKRDDAIKILEEELVFRYGYTLNEFHNSKAAFLNAYDAWQRRSKA